MSIYKKIKQLYQSAPLQGKIFYLLIIIGAFFALVNTILNLILDLPIATVVISILTSITCIFILMYTAKKGSYAKAAFMTFLLLIVFIYPSLWITNAGSRGPTAYFLIFNTLLLTILLTHKQILILMILKALVISLLILVELNWPLLIQGYTSAASQTLDLAISAVLVAFFTLVIIMRLMMEYNSRINELGDVQAQLRKLSITDELTGIYNRRYIIQEINKQIKDLNVPPFSIVMFDIDDFKKINDQHSHLIGDEVIRGVSKLLASHVRPIDVVGRIGGEEFLLLLMDTTEDEARRRAEDIRQSVSQLKWSVPSLVVTVSGGIHCKDKDESLDDILDQVDHYLYQAKALGKNQIA